MLNKKIRAVALECLCLSLIIKLIYQIKKIVEKN